MSKTVTITASNGAKVRTVFSKRIFVVSYGDQHSRYDRETGNFVAVVPPKPVASVDRRTDSYVSALSALKKCYQADVVVVTVKDGVVNQEFLGHNQVEARAAAEKRRKAAEKKDASRSLWY